jgi:hypothetical protein
MSKSRFTKPPAPSPSPDIKPFDDADLLPAVVPAEVALAPVEVPKPVVLAAPKGPQPWKAPFPNSGQVKVKFKADVTVSGTVFRAGETYVVGADFAHANARCIGEA